MPSQPGVARSHGPGYGVRGGHRPEQVQVPRSAAQPAAGAAQSALGWVLGEQGPRDPSSGNQGVTLGRGWRAGESGPGGAGGAEKRKRPVAWNLSPRPSVASLCSGIEKAEVSPDGPGDRRGCRKVLAAPTRGRHPETKGEGRVSGLRNHRAWPQHGLARPRASLLREPGSGGRTPVSGAPGLWEPQQAHPSTEPCSSVASYRAHTFTIRPGSPPPQDCCST